MKAFFIYLIICAMVMAAPESGSTVEKSKKLDWSFTPIAPSATDPLRNHEYPPAYNEIALEIMNDNDIQANDLFSFCEPQLAETQKSKNCHFNPEGSELIALEVSEVIREVLPK